MNRGITEAGSERFRPLAFSIGTHGPWRIQRKEANLESDRVDGLGVILGPRQTENLFQRRRWATARPMMNPAARLDARVIPRIMMATK